MKKRPPDAALALTRPADIDMTVLLRRASPFLLVVGTWMAFHPYQGIIHDARLYIIQALFALQPDVFAADFFVAHGSQDDFTLFTYIFAPLVSWLGPQPASITFVALCHTLWLSGAAALASRLAPDVRAAVTGLVLLAVMPTTYGGWGTFSYGEGFATPRVFAEALCLWALWALICGRHAIAVGLAVLAALNHPLVGGTAFCVGWVFLVLRDWRWGLLGLAALAIVVVAAFAGITPFDRLFQEMDAEWLDIVEQRNVPLFPALWKSVDWSRIVVATTMTAACAATLSGWRRRILIAALVSGLGGLAAMHVGSDQLHNLFLMQIQPYRALWLLQLLAYLASGVLLVRLWRLEPDGIAVIALVAFSWLLGLTLHPELGAIACILAAVLTVARLSGAIAPLRTGFRAVCFGLFAILVAFLVLYRINELAFRVTTLSGGDPWDVIGGPTIIDAIIVVVVVGVLVRIFPIPVQAALPVAALGFFVVSTTGWDSRSDWARAVTDEFPVAPFEAALRPDDQVFWEGDVRGAWLLLRRPSYVSDTQGAGVVFERRTALTFRDRARIVDALTDQELVNTFHTRDRPPAAIPSIDRDVLVAACRSDHELDAMVLPQEVPGAYVARWSLPAPIADVGKQLKGGESPPFHHFFLYRCDKLL